MFRGVWATHTRLHKYATWCHLNNFIFPIQFYHFAIWSRIKFRVRSRCVLYGVDKVCLSLLTYWPVVNVSTIQSCILRIIASSELYFNPLNTRVYLWDNIKSCLFNKIALHWNTCGGMIPQVDPIKAVCFWCAKNEFIQLAQNWITIWGSGESSIGTQWGYESTKFTGSVHVHWHTGATRNTLCSFGV